MKKHVVKVWVSNDGSPKLLELETRQERGELTPGERKELERLRHPEPVPVECETHKSARWFAAALQRFAETRNVRVEGPLEQEGTK